MRANVLEMGVAALLVVALARVDQQLVATLGILLQRLDNLHTEDVRNTSLRGTFEGQTYTELWRSWRLGDLCGCERLGLFLLDRKA